MRFSSTKRNFLSIILIICLSIYNPVFFNAAEVPAITVSGTTATPDPPDISKLFSLSACLMDADSGRILYSKEGDICRPNASTTKILTCILALEYGNLQDYVTVSEYAASMPDVQLNMTAGDHYRLEDLLYSLMLESHNDTAVAIAEHISGTVENFSALMNEKARDLDCYDSHFITPNGLDATEIIDNNQVFHGASASDLCRILSYCIQNDNFLKITRTSNHTFTNYEIGDDGNVVAGSKQHSVINRNAFLSMMEGVLSGKTGFTGDAGYCYVAALKQGNRTYTVALLGCGWPNNKTYKWQDTKTLFTYGLDAFHRTDLFQYNATLPKLHTQNGIPDNSSVSLYIEPSPIQMLVKADDVLSVDYEYFTPVKAPVRKGDLLGVAIYRLNGDIIRKYNIYAANNVDEYDFDYCIRSTIKKFFLS